MSVVGYHLVYNGNTNFNRACLLGDPASKMQITPEDESYLPTYTR